MAVGMARPVKHPKTGVYWLRKRVPADLVAAVGKPQIVKSLGTKDLAEAKRRHLQVLAELEARWENLRVGPRVLTEREAHEIARVVHDRWLEMHRDFPSQQTFWRTELFERLWKRSPTLDMDPEWFTIHQLEQWCGERADEGLAAYGLVVDDQSRLRLAKASMSGGVCSSSSRPFSVTATPDASRRTT
jgi:hypothetical protein